MMSQSLKILVGGGTGFVGKTLVPRLQNKGHQVTLLSRTEGPGKISWDEIKAGKMPKSDAIVNLSGAPIIEGSWTPDRKKVLEDSRVGITQLLLQSINKQAKEDRPKVFVSGSAIGYYPPGDEKVDENYSGPVANNYGGEICEKWEKATEGLDPEIRKVIVRIGIVLGENGGALSQMVTPFKFGLGGPMGSGRQYMPWVHINDLCGIIEHSIENDTVSGVLNGTAPEPVTNTVFSRTIADTLNRPMFLWVPEFLLKLALQERHVLVTEGSRVVPTRTLESGYNYEFTKLEDALADILKK